MTCEQCYHCDVCFRRMTVYGPYALMGMNHDHMEEWCTKCKPKTQIIELSTQIPQSLHDELARHCTEIAYDEERQA